MARTESTVTRVAPEVAAAYEPVIGLEVHVQLKTVTKIFCGCSTRFGDPPNTNTCPVCLGLPGSLPVLNKRALELALRASLALNLQIQKTSRFARKNYFYPDLPKGYQISMYELPLATHGWLEIEHDGAAKKIRRRLSGLMAAAGAVRDLDIAMELLENAGSGGQRQIVSKLKQKRRQANQELFEEVRHWNRQRFSKRWREALGLSL